MNETDAYTFIDTKESWATIYGMLRHLGVAAFDPDYEDYAQEAWLIFYQWLQEPAAAELAPEALRGIAYTRMYRRTLNQLRRNHRHRDMREDDEALAQTPMTANEEFELAWFTRLAFDKLTDRQRVILHWLVDHGDTQTAVADKLGVSRRTVSREIKIVRQQLLRDRIIERPLEA
ncbi:sigma-70 family RNA polymerase sigma factor [Periweissella cryptocerci]|nr:sigma-70 family RNA polymerase sigma factor [Periweissella cryptocerci]